MKGKDTLNQNQTHFFLNNNKTFFKIVDGEKK